MQTTPHSFPEPLEARIAPASVITFIDADNDVVKITASDGTLAQSQLFFAGGGTSGQLERLDLTAASFAGADIVFSVAKKPGGDGQVHVGFIDAAGVDLGNVTVKGDLGRIVAGDATVATNGLGILSVLSLGARGLTTQAAAGTLESVITGTASKLSVKGSVVEASFSVTASLESVVIGRNLVGGNAASSGLIFSQGFMGNALISGSILGGTGDSSGRVAGGSIGDVTIGRNLVGGSGADSGTVESAVSLGKVRVGVNIVGGAGATSGAVLAASSGSDVTVSGSIIGGAGVKSGAVEASSLGVVKVGGELLGRGGERSGSIVSTIGAIGPVTIGGNVDGGAGPNSGVLESETTLGNVKVGRGLIGDSGPGSGRIESTGNMGTVTIGGDVRGGSSDGAGQILSDTGDIGRVAIGGWLVGGNITAPAGSPQTLTDSGVIRAAGRIDGVSLGGSLFAGVAGGGGGALVRSGAIIAGEDLGPISVGGGLLGNDTNPVRIIALGQAAPSQTTDLAIASVTVKGDAVHAEILAGFGFDLVPGNADASVGVVKIAGDWIAGNIIAGAQIGGPLGFQLQSAANDPGLTARIAEIAIGGGILGTAGVVIDRFDFVSQEITKLRIGSALFPLAGGPANDVGVLIPGTNDVRVLEV